MRHKLAQAMAAVLLGLAAANSPALAENAAPVDLRILAINDFHGYLRPPSGGIRISDPDDGGEQAPPQRRRSVTGLTPQRRATTFEGTGRP